MYTVLITGANGWLGTHIIERLHGKYKIIASSFEPESTDAMFDDITSIDTDPAHIAQYVDNSVIIVHCAFARNKAPNSEIASSLDYAKAVFGVAAEKGAYAVINISSQGVYGGNCDERSEKSHPDPSFPYTMAKYASELLLECICGKAGVKTTNIRLDSLAENQNVTVGMLTQALKGSIKVVKGTQKFSFLDVRDAAAAVEALIGIADKKWNSVYNVGWDNTRYGISELAQLAADVVKERTGKTAVIVEEKRDVQLYTGMTTKLFTETTGWRPQYTLKDVFGKLLTGILEQNDGGKK